MTSPFNVPFSIYRSLFVYVIKTIFFFLIKEKAKSISKTCSKPKSSGYLFVLAKGVKFSVLIMKGLTIRLDFIYGSIEIWLFQVGIVFTGIELLFPSFSTVLTRLFLPNPSSHVQIVFVVLYLCTPIKEC